MEEEGGGGEEGEKEKLCKICSMLDLNIKKKNNQHIYI